jgi:pre-mRNA-processing factor 40
MFVTPSLSVKVTFVNVLQDKRFEIQQKTTFEEFLTLMQTDRRTANIDRDALSLIFGRVS